MPGLRFLRIPFLDRLLRRRKYVPLEDPQPPLIPLTSPPPSAAAAAPAAASPHEESPLHDLPRSATFSGSSKSGSSSRRSSLAALPTLRRSKSSNAEPASAAARAAVDRFLAGPEPETEEERHRRECVDVLRKLSASGRVSGYSR